MSLIWFIIPEKDNPSKPKISSKHVMLKPAFIWFKWQDLFSETDQDTVQDLHYLHEKVSHELFDCEFWVSKDSSGLKG